MSKLLQILVRGLTVDYTMALGVINQCNYISLINSFTDNLSVIQEMGHCVWDYKLLMLFITHYFRSIQSASDDLAGQFA